MATYSCELWKGWWKNLFFYGWLANVMMMKSNDSIEKLAKDDNFLTKPLGRYPRKVVPMA